MKLLVCCVFVVLACQSTLADWVRQPFWYDDARRDKVAKGTVWPQPKSIQTSTQSLSLNPDSFSFATTANAATSDACKDVLDPALERSAPCAQSYYREMALVTIALLKVYKIGFTTEKHGQHCLSSLVFGLCTEI